MAFLHAQLHNGSAWLSLADPVTSITPSIFCGSHWHQRWRCILDTSAAASHSAFANTPSKKHENIWWGQHPSSWLYMRGTSAVPVMRTTGRCITWPLDLCCFTKLVISKQNTELHVSRAETNSPGKLFILGQRLVGGQRWAWCCPMPTVSCTVNYRLYYSKVLYGPLTLLLQVTVETARLLQFTGTHIFRDVQLAGVALWLWGKPWCPGWLM